MQRGECRAGLAIGRTGGLAGLLGREVYLTPPAAAAAAAAAAAQWWAGPGESPG